MDFKKRIEELKIEKLELEIELMRAESILNRQVMVLTELVPTMFDKQLGDDFLTRDDLPEGAITNDGRTSLESLRDIIHNMYRIVFSDINPPIY